MSSINPNSYLYQSQIDAKKIDELYDKSFFEIINSDI